MSDLGEEEFDSDGQSHGSEVLEDDDDDYGVSLPRQGLTHTQNSPLRVPQLPLPHLRRDGIPVNTPGSGRVRIDLLSEAFCFDQTLMTQAITEQGMTMHGVVAAAFEQALHVPHHQLKFYHLREITSPTQLQTNQRIGVAIQSSGKILLRAYGTILL